MCKAGPLISRLLPLSQELPTDHLSPPLLTDWGSSPRVKEGSLSCSSL